MTRPVALYTAESRVRARGAVVAAMFRGLRDGRYAAYRLALKDVRGGYAKTVFGLLWDLADPLVFGAIFYGLMAAGVLSPGDLAMPYPLFVTFGMLLYLTFTQSWLGTMRLFQTHRSILSHVRIAPETLLLSVAFRSAFDSLFRILVLLIFSVLMGHFSPLGFLKFVALFPLVILAGMAPGLILAPFNALLYDVERAVKLIILPLRFASPVFFVIASEGLTRINPVAVLINNLRDLATTNHFSDPAALAGWSVALGLLFLAGWLLFHLAAPVIAERA